MGLTQKQEKYSQQYVLLGNKSQAYRNSYNAGNMANESIWVKANEVHKNVKVSVRIKELQDELAERNRMTLDKTVQSISEIANFDISEMYDEDGNLLNIKNIPKHVRTSINNLKTTEEFVGFGKERELVGFTKEVKIINKLDALKELMRMFGAYEIDNTQKSQSKTLTVKIID